jgi:hypothetical protein
MLNLNLLFFNFNLLVFIKIGFLVADLIFAVFAIVIIRQAYSMHSIVSDASDTFIIKSAAFLLLIFAALLFVFALVIL